MFGSFKSHEQVDDFYKKKYKKILCNLVNMQSVLTSTVDVKVLFATTCTHVLMRIVYKYFCRYSTAIHNSCNLHGLYVSQQSVQEK